VEEEADEYESKDEAEETERGKLAWGDADLDRSETFVESDAEESSSSFSCWRLTIFTSLGFRDDFVSFVRFFFGLGDRSDSESDSSSDWFKLVSFPRPLLTSDILDLFFGLGADSLVDVVAFGLAGKPERLFGALTLVCCRICSCCLTTSATIVSALQRGFLVDVPRFRSQISHLNLSAEFLYVHRLQSHQPTSSMLTNMLQYYSRESQTCI